MNDFEIKGADQFLKLSKSLKAAGETETRKALHKGLRDVVNREKPNVAKGLAEALPSGLAARGGRVKQAAQVKTGTDPGVSVVVRHGKATTGLGARNAQLVNRHGRFRRPVFADATRPRKAWRWVNQKVPDGLGWFDKGWANAAPKIRVELERVLEQVADDVVRKAR